MSQDLQFAQDRPLDPDEHRDERELAEERAGAGAESPLAEQEEHGYGGSSAETGGFYDDEGATVTSADRGDRERAEER